MKTLGGYDLEATFNTKISNSVNPLLNFPDAKPPLSHDFPEEDGTQYDTDTPPTFQSRTFIFNCVTSGDSISDCKAAYLALFSLLRQPGLKQYYDDFLDIAVNLIYQKQTGFQDLYENSDGGWSLKYSLQFTESNPNDNLPTILLVDDQNRVLVP